MYVCRSCVGTRVCLLVNSLLFPVTYKLLDNNNKGYFAQEDLREVFINLFGAQTDAVRRHIESFVQKLILEADLTHDGKISFQEFSKVYGFLLFCCIPTDPQKNLIASHFEIFPLECPVFHG